MSLDRRTFRFAALGFAVTAVFVAYQLITDPESPVTRTPGLMLAFAVLCPPSLLSLPFMDIEAGTNGFFVLWGVIGLLNAALYATIRNLIARRQRRPD